MTTLYFVLLIVVAIIGGIILFSKMSSDGVKLGNEETDMAEKMAVNDSVSAIPPVQFEKTTIGKALEKAWEVFQDKYSTDIIELDTDTTGCQISIDYQGRIPHIQLTYAFKVDINLLKVPDYIREHYNGDLLAIRYCWPDEKGLITEQIQETLGGTLESIVRYYYWEGECEMDVRIQAAREYSLSYSKVGGLHGIEHWDRVYQNAQELLTPEVNAVVVGLFAYFHDLCRENECEDLQHGERAAALVAQLRDSLLKEVGDEEIYLLREACRLHTVTHKTGNPTIDACFDADRLDLGRVGITPDPARMATEIGKKMAKDFR